MGGADESCNHVCVHAWWGLPAHPRCAASAFRSDTRYACAALSYLLAAVSPNMDVANAMLPILAGSCLLFNGFFIRQQDLPVYWRW